MFDKYTEPLHPNIINLNPWLRELFPLLNKTQISATLKIKCNRVKLPIQQEVNLFSLACSN